MPEFLRQVSRPVTLENLQIGIKKREKQWDDHNKLYMELEKWRPQGITQNFWELLFEKLKKWNAFRPKPEEEIYQEGRRKLDKLRALYNELSKRGDPSLLTIETLTWDNVSPLFELANSIKGMRLPTFGSKLCHFLLPSSYFIFDNTLVKKVSKWGDDYQIYWEDLKFEWLKATEKESLKKELRKHISSTPCSSYPWSTKITELCQYSKNNR